MNNVLKAIKLNFELVRPYWKSIAFSLLFPTVFAVMNRSIFSGISFAMAFIAMTASYPFSISEKNDMERLYSILPVSKKQLVMGRYFYTGIMGFLSLLIALIVHPLVLRELGTAVHAVDIIIAAVTGVLLFTMYTVFLLPGYYKYGSIKGRFFIFIPVAGYLVTLMFAAHFQINGTIILDMVSHHHLISIIAALLFCAIAFIVSILVSTRILQNKD